MSDLFLILVLLLVGYTLVLLEVFLLPGLVVGIIGAGSVGAGCYLAWTRYGAAAGGLTIIGSFVLMVGGVIAFFKSPWGRRTRLQTELGKEAGYTVAQKHFQELLGKEGEAASILRPAGVMMIGHERYDVVTAGEFIERGVKVRVVAVEGNRIVVEKVKA